MIVKHTTSKSKSIEGAVSNWECDIYYQMDNSFAAAIARGIINRKHHWYEILHEVYILCGDSAEHVIDSMNDAGGLFNHGMRGINVSD